MFIQNGSGTLNIQHTVIIEEDSIPLDADIKLFYFFARPGSFAQERQARLDAGIKPETPDVDNTAQVFPPKMFDELSQNHFQCFPVKRIFCPHSDKSKNKINKTSCGPNLLFCQQRKLHDHLPYIEIRV